MRDDVGEGVASKSSSELHIDVLNDGLTGFRDSRRILHRKRHLADDRLRDHVTIIPVSWSTTQMSSELGDILVNVNAMVKDYWCASGSRNSDLSRMEETRTDSSTG